MTELRGYFVQERAHLDFGGYGTNAVLESRLDYIDLAGSLHTAWPGLITDGRSGRIGYYLIGTPFRTVHLRSALLHDWHCAKCKLLPAHTRATPRRGADRLFRECLRQSGVGQCKAWIMYQAVRIYTHCHADDLPTSWRVDFISREASERGDLLMVTATGK